jgi:phage terminase large subunit-like protein
MVLDASNFFLLLDFCFIFWMRARDKVTQNKKNRAGPFSSMAEAGNVFVVPTGWDIMGYLDELETFPDADHDDMVDASSGAFNMLNRYEPVGGDGAPSIFGDRW